MFLLVCGEDSTASRNHIHGLKQSYRQKQHRVVEITPQELDETLKNEMDVNLFGEPTIYFIQGLLAYWGKQKKKSADEIKKLHENQTIKIINWEANKSLYDLKMKPSSTVKEFKLDTSVFDLQDMLMPGKKVQFIEKLTKLKQSQDPFLLYSLIHRHTRLLLLLNTGQRPLRANPYVVNKASGQSRKWETTKLKQFYLGLSKIDQAVKTSSTPFDIPQSLEILACYYL